MRGIAIIFLTVTSFLVGCDNSELTTKIDSLEKSNQELTVLNEKLSTTLKDSVKYYQLVVDELTAQSDSIEHDKSVIDSLTRSPKKSAKKSANSKCVFGERLVNALSAAEKYYKGSISYHEAGSIYESAYSSFVQVQNGLTQKDMEDVRTTMMSIEEILQKEYYSSEERMSLQLWMVLSKKKCKEIKGRLCE